jgi:hypothetical protein
VDRLAYEWCQWQAETALLSKTASAFQDHFNDVMEAVHGSAFIRVRPAGSVGDRKCDGYLRPTDTVFQVYVQRVGVAAEHIGEHFDAWAAANCAAGGAARELRNDRGKPKPARLILLTRRLAPRWVGWRCARCGSRRGSRFHSG